MTERDIHDKAALFFEDLWKRGDPWALESSDYEQRRYEQLLRTIADRRYSSVLEIGCGAGTFTRRLAQIADHVLALDVSATAIERARSITREAGATITFRVANVMQYDLSAECPFDLVVMSETVYYLGWLHSFFDVGWLAHQLYEATHPGGRLLMANTQGILSDYLLMPWLIRTYHDLFGNVGFQLETESVHVDVKDGLRVEVLISLFQKS